MLTRRLALGIGASLAFTVGAASMAIASGTAGAPAGGFGSKTFSPNEQDAAWTSNDFTTRSERFSRFLVVWAASRGPATITVSGKFSGGPLALRVVKLQNGRVLKPGPVQFDPSGHRRGFSFTFFSPHGASNCTAYSVEFKSVTGVQVGLSSALAVTSYGRLTSNKRTC